MKTRRLRETAGETPEDSLPEWLPNGWTVEVRNTRRGKYRCYRCPVSGSTFQSKEEVLHHLSGVKHGDGASRRASRSNESKTQLVEEMKESLEWLPSGWILEIRTRRSGKSTGKKYKCYFEPMSGHRFYSKVEVLRFLSSRKFHERTSGGKKHLDRNSTDNVIAHIEYSPDGSPHGWIKETKFSEANGSLTKNLSSASAKKLKSKPIVKKHHLTEEILSNGELSETSTFSDGLPLPPFSHENVEVKPEERNAQESATLSPPCSLNPSKSTPKNGRIPKTKGTRKSNISNEKTTVEIEENIKLEVVTKKPGGPLNQTVIDTQFDGKELAKHAEDGANPARGSKRESVSNSKENSKEEDKVMPEVESVTVMFPLASNEKSNKEDFLDLRNNNLSELEKELPAVVGNPSTPDLVKPKHGNRKSKAANAISRPQRFSRRLARVEADLAEDVDMGGEHPRKSKSKNAMTEESPQKAMEGEATKTTECLKRKNTMENGAAAVNQVNQATINWQDFPSTSPFGDSWLDPCLEFAFKTLTGDLPVLDDAIAIQEYFQRQLVSVVGSTNADLHSPLSNNKTEGTPPSNSCNGE